MRNIPSLEIIRQRFAGSTFSDKVPPTELEHGAFLDCQPVSSDQVPDAMKMLFKQRQATLVSLWPDRLVAGLIVQVTLGPSDDDPYSPIEPLAVLLDREVSPDRWRGWLVGRDIGYASIHDLVLGPEEEPLDPQCQIVQVWNVTLLPVEYAGRKLGSLSEARLNAVRSMECDIAANRCPVGILDDRMGVLVARELSDGTGVVTGTPVTKPDDPRNEYADIYRHAAASVSQQHPARQEVAKPKMRWLDFFPNRRLGMAITVAFVAIIGSLLFQYAVNHPESSVGEVRYIAGHGIQQIIVETPAETAVIIEQRLRSLGITPEIRHEAGGGIFIQADLSMLSADSRTVLLKEIHVPHSEDETLTLLLIRRE